VFYIAEMIVIKQGAKNWFEEKLLFPLFFIHIIDSFPPVKFAKAFDWQSNIIE